MQGLVQQIKMHISFSLHLSGTQAISCREQLRSIKERLAGVQMALRKERIKSKCFSSVLFTASRQKRGYEKLNIFVSDSDLS